VGNPPGPHPIGTPHSFLVQLDACIAEWERALGGPSLQRDAGLYGLIQRTAGVEHESLRAGFGGVGAHLRLLVQGAMTAHGVQPLRDELEIVRAMRGQVRDALEALGATVVSPRAPAPARAEAAPAGAEPPPLITRFPQQQPVSPTGRPGPGSVRPPAPLSAPHAPRPSDGPAPQLALPRSLFESVLAPGVPDLRHGAPSKDTRVSEPPPKAAPSPPPPADQGSFHAAPVPRSVGLPSPAPSAPQRPNLFVRSLLGLRHPFARGAAAPSAPPVAPHGLAAAPSGMLGLQHHASGSNRVAPPPLIGGYAGLPPLPPAADGGHAPRVPTTPPRDRRPSAPPPRQGRARMLRGDENEGRWWVGVLAVLGVGLIVGLIVTVAVLVSRRSRPDGSSATAGGPSGTAVAAQGSAANGAPPSDGASLPHSRLLSDNERFRALLNQVHGRGKESGELRNLVDEQAAIAAQAVSLAGCTGPQCAALRELNQFVGGKEPKKKIRRRARSPDALRSGWLAGLAMPEIPVEDDPRVQRRFEFYTENAVGRETFQQMLFRCGAFRDSIQSTLIRHGLPAALIAVVFVESGCAPLAKSPMGAEGLWQFIPEAARAYHLRIIPDMVDERHSPQKSTEAAVRYLGDLYAKLDAWDLVFAAYNMGPFGLLTRMNQVEGGDAGFWDLVDAELLPDETADYAPTIEAVALILNNLQRLKFAGVQMRAPEVTSELEVPPGTRLSLVARAAAMSVNELRRLNLDVQAGITPNVPNFAVQVPKDSVWQARETLQELLKSRDESDRCVPPSFDWGRQRFTPEMARACRANLEGAPVPTAPSQPAPAPTATE